MRVKIPSFFATVIYLEMNHKQKYTLFEELCSYLANQVFVYTSYGLVLFSLGNRSPSEWICACIILSFDTYITSSFHKCKFYWTAGLGCHFRSVSWEKGIFSISLSFCISVLVCTFVFSHILRVLIKILSLWKRYFLYLVFLYNDITLR